MSGKTVLPGAAGPYRWAVSVIAVLLACTSIGLGLTLMFGAPTRTAGVSFANIRAFAPMHIWGVALFAAGALALVGQWRVRRLLWVGHGVSAMVCFFWVGAFVLGLSNPQASGTGPWAYLGLGLTHAVVAAVHARQE